MHMSILRYPWSTFLQNGKYVIWEATSPFCLCAGEVVREQLRPQEMCTGKAGFLGEGAGDQVGREGNHQGSCMASWADRRQGTQEGTTDNILLLQSSLEISIEELIPRPVTSFHRTLVSTDIHSFNQSLNHRSFYMPTGHNALG